MPRGHYVRTFRPLPERFRKKYSVNPESGCWEWLGSLGPSGYGQISMRTEDRKRYRVYGAHIASWMIHRGDIPDGMCVLHACDNPGCVRPDHLFLGTTKDNALDKVSKGRARGAKRGESHHFSKLSSCDIVTIKADAGSGSDASRRFGVSRSTISRIRRGMAWKHL